jgi:hypothetical protein
MARKDYFFSAAPEPWQILGLTLRPFSVGHYIKLRRFDCAFVADEPRDAGLQDLVIGVAVCCMASHPDQSKDEFWQWYNRSRPEGFLSGLAYKIEGKVNRLLKRQHLTPAEQDMFELGRRAGNFDFKEKAELFQKYIDTHTASLDYWLEPEKDSAGPIKSGAHWVHSMLTTLTGKCGYELIDAYNVSFGQCLNDYLLEAERNGAIRIMTAQESEFTAGIGKVVTGE